MDSESGESNEKPVHKVRICESFFISKYEVAFEQYDRFSPITGKGMKVGDLPVPFDNGWGRAKRPVINVSWYDARVQ